MSFTDGGWGAGLADRFARQADVVLRGLSGYNTRWALKVLPRAMEGAAAAGADPAAVTIFFGANDASLLEGLAARSLRTAQRRAGGHGERRAGQRRRLKRTELDLSVAKGHDSLLRGAMCSRRLPQNRRVSQTKSKLT
ncbi:hypothetical protein EJB05_27327, partial [Eragrostis curvula]